MTRLVMFFTSWGKSESISSSSFVTYIPNQSLLRWLFYWTLWPWKGPVQAQVISSFHTILNQDLDFSGSVGIVSRCSNRWWRSNLDQDNVPHFRVAFSVLPDIPLGLHMKAVFEFPLVGWPSSLLALIRYWRSMRASDWVFSSARRTSWYLCFVLFPHPQAPGIMSSYTLI